MKQSMKKTLAVLIAVAAAATALTGCGTYFAGQDIRENQQQTGSRAGQLQQVVQDRAKQARAEAVRQQDVAVPWLAGQSVPLSKDMSQPAILRTKITAVSAECNQNTYSLQRLANCITGLVGVPVRIKPDALLPSSQFVLRRSSATGGSAATATAPELLSVTPVNIELGNLLDMADATFGVNHRVTESGAIEIYRLDTRVLRLKALAQKIPQSITTSAGFKEESKTVYENTAVDALSAMRTALMSMGTVAGSIEINPDTKSVIVTDTPDTIARIEAYLEAENKRLTRRITLIFEELFVTSKHGQEASIDWTVLYKRASGNINSIASPKSLVGGSQGSLGFSAASTGELSGSSAILQALDEQGFVVTKRTFPISTLNGSAQTIGLPTVFDYVASVASNMSTSSIGSISAPTITQKEDRVGVFLTATPEAQDDGQILISINIADRTGTLTPYTVQVGGSNTTVQQRNFQEANLTGRTVVRSGVTHVIGGLDESNQGSTSRRFDESAPLVLGGSDASYKNSRRIILLVTAIAQDSI